MGIRQAEARQDRAIIDCGYPVELLADIEREFDDYVRNYRPNIVWSQLEGHREIITLAHERGIRSLLFIHDAEFDARQLKELAFITNGIVCSSHFLASKVKEATGRIAQVIYPCPKTDFGVRGDPQGYITMINPHPVKGLETFLKIAQALPKEKFLLVESWRLSDEALNDLKEKLAPLANVTFMRRVPDMRRVYGQTKLLLVPSTWEEGFGMVAVEAASCHIPVIASARGGLPEAVGQGGIIITDYTNPDKWVQAINSLLGQQQAYRKLSQAAARHAKQNIFSATKSADAFLALCQEIASLGANQFVGETFLFRLRKLLKRPLH